MKKIFLAGSGGMLGEAFRDVFKDDYILKCTDIDLNSDWLEYLDFRDFDKYLNMCEKFKPNYLFHLGAFTNLEYCEKNINSTYMTNTLSVENAVFIANKLRIPLLYISTAGIFDGKKDFYNDYDTPNPMGHYAKSKFYGENFVINNSKKYIISRAGWMMGGGLKKDKKFIKKIIQQLIDGKKELNIVNDKLGTPTYTYDFAKNVKILIENEYWGLYNMVCEGRTSRLEVVNELLKLLNLSKKIKVNEVSSDFLIKEYFAPRPNNEQLINFKLNLRNLNIMRDWKLCLKDYVNKDFSFLLKND